MGGEGQEIASVRVGSLRIVDGEAKAIARQPHELGEKLRQALTLYPVDAVEGGSEAVRELDGERGLADAAHPDDAEVTDGHLVQLADQPKVDGEEVVLAADEVVVRREGHVPPHRSAKVIPPGEGRAARDVPRHLAAAGARAHERHALHVLDLGRQRRRPGTQAGHDQLLERARGEPFVPHPAGGRRLLAPEQTEEIGPGERLGDLGGPVVLEPALVAPHVEARGSERSLQGDGRRAVSGGITDEDAGHLRVDPWGLRGNAIAGRVPVT